MTPLLAHGLRTDRSFERIYQRHVGDVYRYALAVLRNPADAEDVTQTTFLNAYRAYAGGERPRQAQNWLIAIAHNVCRQRFRQSQRRPQEVAFDENVGEWLEEEERGPTADDLRRALSHLAFNQRAALVMRELEGRSYAEIAEILGLTVAAVETLIFRARRALREQLEGTLTCAEAERALSLEADGRLARADKGPLRAHLRECKECASAARRQRAHRSAWKALGALPVPASLSTFFGGGGTAIGVKAAAVAASAIAAGGLGLAGEQHFRLHLTKEKRHPAARRAPARATAPVAAQRIVHTPAAIAVSRAVPLAPVRHGSGGGDGEGHGRSASGDESSSGAARQPHDQARGDSNSSGQSHDGEGRHNGGSGDRHQGDGSGDQHQGDGEHSGGRRSEQQSVATQHDGNGQSGDSHHGGDGQGGGDNQGDGGHDSQAPKDAVQLPQLPQLPVPELPGNPGD